MIKERKNKTLGLAVAALVATGTALWADAGHKHESAKEEAVQEDVVTVTGEVLDLSCYLGHGAKGKEHQKCAKDCLIKKNVPAGLLTAEGSVYLLVEDHKYEKAFKPVKELAAKQAKITGRKVIKGGLQAILVEKVEKI